jgi:hypothetical protein
LKIATGLPSLIFSRYDCEPGMLLSDDLQWK